MIAKKSNYAIVPVSPKYVDRAYPLIRAVAPQLDLEGWQQFCRGLSDPPPMGEREQTIVAVNAEGYVKGICVFVIREHWMYGRLLDAPVFVVASAADAEGVGRGLLQALADCANGSVCSGIRIWTIGSGTWERRLAHDDIHRTDHGVFVPAIASIAQMDQALSACTLAESAAIDRLSR